MAAVLPGSWRYQLMRWGWPPQNRFVRGGLSSLQYALALLILQVFTLLLHLPGSGWVQAAVITLAVLALLLFAIAGFGWVRQKLLWRLRNRLIVTYVFIGVIPVLLLVAMTMIAFYLFAGQFANVVVTQDLNAELKSLEATNFTLAHSLADGMRREDFKPFTLLDELYVANHASTPKEVCAWYGNKPLLLSATRGTCSMKAPENFPAQFREVVLDRGVLHLRAGTTVNAGTEKLRVVSTSPIDQRLLDRISGSLGTIALSVLTGARRTSESTAASKNRSAASGDDANVTPSSEAPRKPGITAAENGDGIEVEGALQEFLASGTLPDAASRLDIETRYGAPLSVLNWETGAPDFRFVLGGETRPSLLYGHLFATLGQFAALAEGALLGFAIVFAFIVLLALYIGSRLTRTMTRSVANLYTATQHLNRGEFGYRIEVRERDQIAALQTSFNAMAASLEQLMSEQREKQRLENELTIAHEVQAQLFPRQISQLESLEVHGYCKPARTVSGDYYDFLPATANRLGLAVGDVSGKGISAALLMATIHSAVRAYLLESVPAEVLLAGAGGGNGLPRGPGMSPATLMYLLNRQLYSTTPAEKYATLFLALYDGSARRLTYTNAGHLPPILMGKNGGVRRLETGGTVVGLFDDIQYEESTVSLSSGEIFLAYSDGVTEPENDYGEFGEDRLIDLVRANRHLPLDRLSALITNAVYEWIGANEQPDDVTLVLARAR